MKKRLSMHSRHELKEALLSTTASYQEIALTHGVSLSIVYYYAKKFNAKAARKKLAKSAKNPDPRTILRRGRNIDMGDGLYYRAAARFFDSIYRGTRG